LPTIKHFARKNFINIIRRKIFSLQIYFPEKGLFLLWREEYLGLIGESSVAGLVF